MPALLKASTRYLIPFRFGSAGVPAQDAMRMIEKNRDPCGGRWLETSVLGGEHDVYTHILDMFDDNGAARPGSICACYRYETEAPGAEVLRMTYQEKSGEKTQTWYFGITEAGMSLFVSGTGFFWYEMDCPADEKGNLMDPDTLTRFHSRFKELNYRINLSRFHKLDSEDAFLTGDWAARVISAACGNIRFFVERRNVLAGEEGHPIHVPDKALLYQYTVFSGGEAEKECFLPYVYRLTKGYVDHYVLPEDFWSRCLHPMENAVCYAQVEGAGFYVFPKEPKSAAYMTNEMAQRFLKGDYFLIYLLTLNRFYTVQNYEARIGRELPADPKYYLPEDSYLNVSAQEAQEDKADLLNAERQIRRLCMEIEVFLSKSVHGSVSSIEHENSFFRYVEQSLDTKEAIRELREGLGTLLTLLASVASQFSPKDPDVLRWRENEDYKKVQMENSVLRRKLFNDALTGLMNMEGYRYFAPRVLAETKEKGAFLLVVMMDLNGLKHLNDTYGHSAGDLGLILSAESMRDASREHDRLFRRGGDEAEEFGMAFREALVERNRKYRDRIPEGETINVSFGTAMADMSSYKGEIEELIELADQKMYEMKKAGDPYMR